MGNFPRGVREINECDVRENCKTYDKGQCWICNDYSLYNPEDPQILCKRQIREREERKVKKKMLKNSEVSKHGKRAKRKGSSGEREVVKLLQKNKIESEKVPLSGMLKGEKYSCDVTLQVNDETKRGEVKRRKSGLSTIQKWLNEDEHSNYVFFREDHGDWLVAMSFDEFVKLVTKT